MKNSSVFILSSVIFVVIGIVSALFLRPEVSVTYSYAEESLYKNQKLMIEPGEEYIYRYEINGKSSEAAFRVIRMNNCTGIMTISVPNQTIPCFSREGEEKKVGNITISNQQIPLFRPWMLAVHENWKWKVNRSVLLNGEESYIETIKLETIGSENISGRDTFKVKTTVDNVTFYSWVDKQKRILIREESDVYSLVLINSPFALEQQAE